ncbi:MAG: AI-2E family transporter [Clostridia bacterium]|nr:AI-2E family transporter [Clostridia bacterium]
MKNPNQTDNFASKVKVVGKTVTLCICAVVLLVFALFNQWTWQIIATITKIVAPLVYGLMLAFIINYPYEFCYNRLYKKIGTKKPKMLVVRKVLSIVTTYVFLGVIIAFLVAILIPNVVDSINSFVDQLPVYLAHFSTAFTHVATWVNDTFSVDLSDTKAIEDFASKLILGENASLISTSHLLNIALNSIWDFLYGLYNAVIAIIVSVYVIGTKDKLLRQTRKLTLAYVPKRFHKLIRDVKNESYNICGKFIIGKIIDSAIIGVLCFIGLTLIGIDYAVLISVVVGITNIIPFFGPFIGAIPCAILLLLVDPWDCLWFVIFIFGLQQLDGNLIGPKILGDRIGISGIWVLVGVTIGGGLFGFGGMVFGVPVCAVIYTLLGKAVNNKLNKKNNPIQIKG